MTRTLKIAITVGAVVALAAGGYAAVRGKRAEQNPAASATTARVAEFLQNDLYIVEPGAL